MRAASSTRCSVRRRRVRVAEYDPSWRVAVADLMSRGWGARPDEAELGWFYERNPVRPASVMLAVEGDLVIGSVAISFQPTALGEVGFAVHLATDPDYRGRGVFSTLQTANDSRRRSCRAISVHQKCPSTSSVSAGSIPISSGTFCSCA